MAKAESPAQVSLEDQILETWRINHRLNLYLLENVSPEQLKLKSQSSKSVAGHLTHQHNVRLMWLKAAAPEMLAGLEKLDEASDSAAITLAHSGSAAAMENLLAVSLQTGRVKNFKPHPVAFLGYLLAHEAFHRSQAELVLRQAGAPVSDKVAYGLWEWGVR